MIQAIAVLLHGLFWLAVLSLVLGLVKPVLVLWFLDRFNRITVVKVYGSLAALFFLLKLGLRQLF